MRQRKWLLAARFRQHNRALGDLARNQREAGQWLAILPQNELGKRRGACRQNHHAVGIKEAETIDRPTTAWLDIGFQTLSGRAIGRSNPKANGGRQARGWDFESQEVLESAFGQRRAARFSTLPEGRGFENPAIPNHEECVVNR
jgi:hypothetical protein